MLAGSTQWVAWGRRRGWWLGPLFVLALSGRIEAAPAVEPNHELFARARASGSVRALVKLDLPSDLDTGKKSRDRNNRRKRRIAAARERVVKPLGARHVRVVRTFDFVPWIAVEVDAEGLASLSASADVARIREDRLEKALLLESSEIVEALEMHERGVNGDGWAIAILDTGIDANHYFVGGRVAAEACYSRDGSCPNGETSMIGPGAGAPCDYSPDECGHGTHIAGIAAGSGTRGFGIAPGADLISIQIFTRFEGDDCDGETGGSCARTYLSDSVKALEHVYELRNQYSIAAVNMSIGGDTYSSAAECEANDPRTEIVEMLYDAGIVTVAAAGNDGEAGMLSSPACLSSVLSVGATNDSDVVATFSNTAPFLDFFAPGVGIISSYPGDLFAEVSGTSQSAPHVAGVFALLYEELGSADPEVVSTALEATGFPVWVADLGRNVPRIRVAAASALLAPTPTPTPTPTATPLPTQTPPASALPTGLQFSPDGLRTLISRDLAGERWAIVVNADDGTVTGNVFRPDGSEPAFLWCSRVGDDGAADPYARQITFSCYGASPCVAESCAASTWDYISEVELPGSFFLPRLEGSEPDANATVGQAVADGVPGLRVTPDDRRTLVSKDVYGERWAITLNDDGSVTGNVYDPLGGPPQFLWCSDAGNDGHPDPAQRILYFSCYGAPSCEVAPCETAPWSYISEVEVPNDFFLP